MDQGGLRYGDRLPRRRLGRTGIQVPALGLGGAGLGGGYGPVAEEEAIAAVRLALAQGIDYIDTSPLYGDSERRLGIALDGIPRASYHLSTKTGTHPSRRGDYSWEGTLWSVENSLRLLKTDYFDLLLVHDPEDMEPVFAARGALDALEHLKAQGVVRNIGLGVRSHVFHRLAIESGRFDAILTYNDYHPLRTTALELAELAEQHDVGVLNGSPLAHGLLIGEDPLGRNAKMTAALSQTAPAPDVQKASRLYQWCEENGVPMVAVVLQFCLREPRLHCILTGAKTSAELQQNLEAATLPLPPETWGRLAALQLAD
jgi:aryl-alcohol dehydrogenase-like predicted oxidoreductase